MKGQKGEEGLEGKMGLTGPEGPAGPVGPKVNRFSLAVLSYLCLASSFIHLFIRSFVESSDGSRRC